MDEAAAANCSDLLSSRPVQLEPGVCPHLAVHPAQAALLDDQVTRRLQEVRAEVTLLDVVVLVTAVSGPRSGPGRDAEDSSEYG